VALHPIIGDTVAVLRRELGDARAFEILAEAAIDAAVDTIPALGLAVADATCERIEDEATRMLWTALWYRIAEEAPAAFELDPSALSGTVAPTVLAYLYASKQGEGISDYLPGAEEELLEAARAQLQAWTGIDAHASFSVFGERSIALRRTSELDNLVGWSLASEPAVSDRVLLSESYLDSQRERGEEGTRELAELVLHEGIHAGFADAVPTKPQAFAEPLVYAVNEAVVSLLEIAAVAVAEGEAATLETVTDRAACHGYARRIGELLSLLDVSDLAAVAKKITALNKRVLGSGSDAGAARALNKLAGLDLDPEEWADRFVTL
jgi:hypothetical protein